jgi:cold shock protein
MKDTLMPIGTVKFFDATRGFGFITPDDGGNDAFVHISAVMASGMEGLNPDQRVAYDLEPDKRGKVAAANLRGAE